MKAVKQVVQRTSRNTSLGCTVGYVWEAVSLRGLCLRRKMEVGGLPTSTGVQPVDAPKSQRVSCAKTLEIHADC